MSTYTQILYQLVFSTKNREKTLLEHNREKLFRFIWGLLKNKNCKLYQINGIEDHIHIAMHLHPTIPLSSLVKDIKVASSLWIKQNRIFPNFTAWQEGYGAFTYSIKQKEVLINYIKNQQEHHRVKPFREEFIELLTKHGIDFDERYLL
ncbi:IS200/IS605 family transposase [Sunxiuqinia elliptica]|uniref:REP element-mobilizing transposase RayT n=1 Tax=Sunxiuqinia elliptica TaxID=655355 RepID=A0A1I2EA05_9BACT|nr:IS200/IS605 family transposase [Sunxiuqinia elliptica]SFE89844.1 REP element-mobilizing transposase RayT [Sunxiuqinia elliptica]